MQLSTTCQDHNSYGHSSTHMVPVRKRPSTTQIIDIQAMAFAMHLCRPSREHPTFTVEDYAGSAGKMGSTYF